MALLSILDWSLTERQKVKVRGHLETVWLFLSYREPKDLERLMLTTGGRFIVNSISVFLAASLSRLFVGNFNVDEPEALAIVGNVYWIGIAGGVVLTLTYMQWLRGSSDFSKYKKRVDHVSSFAVFLWVGIFLFSDELRRGLPGHLTYAFFAFFCGLLFFTVAAGAISSAALYWRALIWLLRGVLFGVQFVVQRIVEYPKGPILGLSGLLMAIGVLVKILGP